jgi:hypothetical protein
MDQCEIAKEGFECPAEKKINFLQYLNTAILTVIGIFAIMIFITVNDVKSAQSTGLATDTQLKTTQDIMTKDIADLKTRVLALERDNMQAIQQWVENNFVRRDQGK